MNSAANTRKSVQESVDARAMQVLRSGGWSPAFVTVGPSGRIVTEWDTEKEARAYAAEFGKLATVAVGFDADCGWWSTLDPK